MLLSIGMIVKNEEKHLERCLKALLPLKDKIEYEVVIIDTGSTDRTKEIAYKYTDKVYDFEWINDFAAARNYGLEKCTGKWFMFLDADEEIDDCQPLIDFLLSKENQRSKSVTFKFKNYLDESLKTSQITVIPRLFKNENIRFEDKIHESIPAREPIISLDCIINHYGYASNMDKKLERNEKLIDAVLEEEPNNARLLGYKMGTDYRNGNYSDIIKLFNEKKNISINNDELIAGFIKMIKFCIYSYLCLYELDNAKQMVKEYANVLDKHELAYLDINFGFINYWNALNMNDDKLLDDDLLEYVKKYKKVYDNHLNNKYGFYEEALVVPECNKKANYINVVFLLAKYYSKQKNIKKMYSSLDEMYVENNNSLPYIFEFQKIKENADFDRIQRMYMNSVKINKQNQFFDCLQNYRNDNEFYIALLQSLEEINYELESPLKEYVSIILNSEIEESIEFLKNIDALDFKYSDVLYHLMKKNILIDDFKFFENINKQEQYAKALIVSHQDICIVVVNYLKNKKHPSIEMLEFYCNLIYNILTINKDLTDEDYIYLLKLLMQWQLEYAKYLYNENLFSDSKLKFLPIRVQCCYYLEKAMRLISNNESKEGIAYIRMVLKLDENLARGCKLLLPKVEEKKEITEFEAYARKIKDVIIGLINSGKSRDAFAVYQQYKKVNPKDTELDKYFMS